jgi:phage shock protein PspC (stress-responsive transcriptional regulator)
MSETIDTPTLDESPPRRLVRVREGRWLGGVSAGLGRYFDVNPLVYRIAFAALALAGGTGILLYVAAWLVMPAEDRDESIAVETLRTHRDRPWLLLGVGLLGLASVLALSEADFWPGSGNIWFAAILAGAALVWWNLARRDERTATRAVGEQPPAAAARPRRPSATLPVFGALLAAAGVLGLLAVLDVYEADVRVALAVGVAVVGLAIAVGAQTGRRVGGLIVLGLVLLAAFGAAASSPVSFNSGIGERVERPLLESELERSYELGIGDFTVDLANVELPPGRTEVDVNLGIGEVVVTVPREAAIDVDGRSGIGEVDVLGETKDGTGAQERVVLPGATAGAPLLVLDADVAIGRVEVRRG